MRCCPAGGILSLSSRSNAESRMLEPLSVSSNSYQCELIINPCSCCFQSIITPRLYTTFRGALWRRQIHSNPFRLSTISPFRLVVQVKEAIFMAESAPPSRLAQSKR